MRWILFACALLAPDLARSAVQCEAVPVLAADTRESLRGIEDIVLDHVAGIAYLSAYDRWTVANEVGGPVTRTTQGGIYALPLAGLAETLPSRLTAVSLTRTFSAETDFHPHGIDLYVAPSGARTLFAVSHRFLYSGGDWREEPTIEIFDVRDGALIHRASLSHPFISTPNDLVATGPGSFFVTNDHGYAEGLGRAAEDLFGHGLGSVVSVDLARPPAERVQTLFTGIAFANGIALSPDKRFLHIGSTRDKALLTYEIRRPNAPPRKVPLPLGPDNLSWGADGRLYVGGHPSLIRYGLYAKTANWGWGLRRSPSAVIRLDPAAQNPAATIEHLFDDDGRILSGATVGAAGDGIMLVGTARADRIGVCRL